MAQPNAASSRKAEIGLVPQSWEVAPLGDYTTRVTYGFTNPMPTKSLGPYMVTAKDVVGGRINYSTARHTSWDAYHNDVTDKSRPRIGDVLLTKDGSIGRVALCDRPDVCINQSVALIQPNGRIDSLFLKYLLEGNYYQHRMAADAGGATIKHIYITRVGKMQIAVPPLPTQRKIASILSAYDDLIENNTRRIAIAEEMAQAIYREWFVNFRFPGHENVKLVDSPLGMIPEGWEVGELQHLVSFANGKSIKPGGEGAYVAFGSNGPIGHSHEFRYQCGIIIRRVGAYCGSVAYSPHPFWASDNTIVALSQHDDSFIPFVLYMLQDMNLNRHAGGAAQPLLTQTTLKKLQIVTPPNETIEVFCEVVSLILTETSCLEKKSHNLRTTRDLLLPKLISGKLDVEDLDIDVTALAAEGGEDG